MMPITTRKLGVAPIIALAASLVGFGQEGIEPKLRNLEPVLAAEDKGVCVIRKPMESGLVAFQALVGDPKKMKCEVGTSTQLILVSKGDDLRHTDFTKKVLGACERVVANKNERVGCLMSVANTIPAISGGKVK